MLTEPTGDARIAALFVVHAIGVRHDLETVLAKLRQLPPNLETHDLAAELAQLNSDIAEMAEVAGIDCRLLETPGVQH